MNKHHKRQNYPTQIDIPIEFRPQVIEMLNLTLATIMDLQTSIGQSQWNQEMNLTLPHSLFDEIVPVLEEYIDKFAAWLAALNEQAIKTARAQAKQSVLPEYPLNILSIKEEVSALADRLAPYAKSMRNGIDKTGELGEAAAAKKETRMRKSQLRHAISKGLIKSQNSQDSDGQEYYLPTSGPRLPAAWS